MSRIPTDLSGFSPKKQYTTLFVLSFITAATFFIPYIIQDGGPFFFFGDYNVQQIPFYMLANDAIKHGNIFWSWTTDLGANFIGSYSFYNLGSPFFWLAMIFPASAMAYVLPWLLCLKFSFAAICAFAFIKRFVKKTEYAFIGSLLYAFSSFSIYNIFFNHFHECIAFFPLILIGLEELVENDRKGLFALAMALNAFMNIIFFVSECVFLLIYFFIRLRSDSWKKIDLKKLLHIYFEAIIGVGIAAVLFLPSFLSITQVPRSGQKLSGFNMLMYYELKLYPNIFNSFFAPSELPSRPNFYPGIGAKWSSFAAWLPLFGLTGAIAWMKRVKKDWIAKLLIVLFVMTAVPILNNSFQLFNDNIYTRWFYMFVLILALATAMSFENSSDEELYKGYKWMAVLTLVFTLPVGIIPKTINMLGEPGKYIDALLNYMTDFNKNKGTIGLTDYPDKYWFYMVVIAVCLVVAFILIKQVKRDNKYFFIFTVAFIVFITSVCANFYISWGKSAGENSKEMIQESLNGRKNITLPDIDNVRSDVLKGMDNQAMYWQIPNIQTFHSVVPGSITDFFMSVGVQRDVGSRPEASHVWLRSLLSVKYLFDQNNQETIGTYGWHKIGTQNNFGVWENENYIPIGFTYDNYITTKQFNDTAKEQREKLLIKGILLTETQIINYGYNLSTVMNLDVNNISDDELRSDAARRKQTTIQNFKRDNTGFEGDITLNKNNLVFFSVPYEQGWTATVNGQPAKIEKVNMGFMAVYCNSGAASHIRFNYMTPGLIPGIAITVVSAALLIAYMLYYKKKKEQEEEAERKALASQQVKKGKKR